MRTPQLAQHSGATNLGNCGLANILLWHCHPNMHIAAQRSSSSSHSVFLTSPAWFCIDIHGVTHFSLVAGAQPCPLPSLVISVSEPLSSFLCLILAAQSRPVAHERKPVEATPRPRYSSWSWSLGGRWCSNR